MPPPVFKRILLVADEPHEITVYQNSMSFWIAIGDCRDERVEAQGRSDSQAESAWRDAAQAVDA